MELTLAFSGGHTRSNLIAIVDNQIVGSAWSEGMNDHVMVDDGHYYYQNGYFYSKFSKLVAMLATSIRERGLLIQKIETHLDVLKHTRRLFVAMPGVSTALDYRRVADNFSRLWNLEELDLLIVDDTWANLIAGSMCNRGISVIAGTGASVYIGIDDFHLGKTYKLDGFGSLLGDWGSGFRLAVRLLEESTRFTDRESIVSDSKKGFVLEGELLECARRIMPASLLGDHEEIHSIEDLQNWFDELLRCNDRDWRPRLAHFASVATIDADGANPHQLSVDLVKEAAAQLAETVSFSFKRLNQMSNLPGDLVPESIPIVCKGGQFENSKRFCEEFIEELRGNYHIENPIKFSEFSPVIGAALWGLSSRTGTLSTPELQGLLRSIRAWPSAQEEGLVVTYSHTPTPNV